MEETNNDPFEMNSFYMNKKRKSPYETSGLPLPKHKCWNRSPTSECDFPCDPHLDTEELKKCINEGKNDSGARDDQLEAESAKDSNSLLEDANSVMSVSDEAKAELQYLKICPFDRPSIPSVNLVGSSSIPSVNLVGSSSNTSIYYLDGKSEAKSSDSGGQLQYIGGKHISPDPNFGLYTFLNYEEHLLDLGNLVDCDSSEYRNDSIEVCQDKEIEALLNSNDVISNKYVLSSGRWNVDQETQQGTKKLTIDKEFDSTFPCLCYHEISGA